MYCLWKKCRRIQKNTKKYPSSQNWKPSQQHSCYGTSSPPFWARPTSGFCLPSVCWKHLVLPGGSFSFEDWCLEEDSGKPPAICFSLCSGQDHTEICLEKSYNSSWASGSEISSGCAGRLTTSPAEDREEAHLGGQSQRSKTEHHITSHTSLCSLPQYSVLGLGEFSINHFTCKWFV